MTTSFPETKTGLRFGLASLAATACLAAILAASLPVRAQDNPVLAKVNGVEIRQSDVALAEEELGPSLAQMDPATKKDNVLAFLIDLKIVAKAAEDKKVENSEDFKKRMAFTRSRLLMDSLLATEGKAATTEDAMKKVYEEASKQITGEMEVHARHILVETEDEAKAVAEELKKGGDFADLAKKKSKDPGAADGGDLGFFTKEQMVPEFSAVAFTLDPGKISDPVKSQFGWHIIKVEEKRNRQAPAFDQVADGARHRGGKENGLTFLGRILQNGFDVLAETHVQHHVGFVEDHHLQRVEADGAAPHVIHDAARRADRRDGRLGCTRCCDRKSTSICARIGRGAD